MTICTIAIPVYNRERQLGQAIESALAQDGSDIEILVIDNCSTDRSWEIANSYRDPRLRLVRNETNLGLFGNFNRCLELSSGRYLRILGSDDRLIPGCIRQEVDLIERHPNVGLLSTRSWAVDASYRRTRMMADLLRPGEYRGQDMIGATLWMLAHHNGTPLNLPSGILLRKSATELAGRFDLHMRLLGDVDYWLKMMTAGDVLITDIFGCEVMEHTGQATFSLNSSGYYSYELSMLARRWSPYLSRQGIREQVVEQLAICALLIAMNYLRKRHFKPAGLHWISATSQGLSPVEFGRGVFRRIWVRWQYRRNHIDPFVKTLPVANGLGAGR
jgi:glycosyltransferase involved in cell wall biosynthesis